MTPVLAPPVESAPRRSLAAFVSLVLAELGARGLRYCVLHTWDELPENLPSDLDMAIVAEDLWRISGVLAALDAQGYRPVQLFNYARNAYYFVFAWDEDGAIGTGAIDFITEHREDNLILTTAEELVQGRRLFRGFWIPSAAAGYRYLLSKKVLKGALSDRQARQLGRLARELGPAAATQICARLFGRGIAQQAAAASAGETLSELLPLLRRKMMRRVMTHEPWTPLWCVLTEAPRAARRFLRPTGAMIAVLGPDGAGKSTLLDTLGAQFTGAFRQHHLFHWRPGLLFAQRPSRTTDPHGQSSFGYLRSIAHLAGHFADHLLAFPLRVRPLLVRSSLLRFDRHFHDVLADPHRYRYSGPMRFAQMLASLVPAPDLMLILDAPASTVLVRKNETTAERIEAARDRYRSLAKLPFARLINADAEPHAVALEASLAIMDFLARRFRRRYPRWLGESSAAVDEAARLLAGPDSGERRCYAVMPGLAEPRWLVSRDGDSGRAHSLAVYTPYQPKARLFKAALPIAERFCPEVTLPAQGWIHEFARAHFGGEASFTVSLNTPGRYRKATIQISRRGRVLGFVKAPLGREAAARVEHEAAVLTRLAGHASIRASVPKLLYAGSWEGRSVLLTAPLEGKRGPVQFGAAHALFLRDLAAVEPVTRKMSALMDETWREWEQAAGPVDSGSRDLVENALRFTSREHVDTVVECGLSHGDFAPWNTRISAAGLAVFDWEAAESGKPCAWDALHFEAQTASLLRTRQRSLTTDWSANPAALLYLIHSSARLLLEQGVLGGDVEWRLRQLRRQGGRHAH